MADPDCAIYNIKWWDKYLYRIMITAKLFLSIEPRAMTQHRPKPDYEISKP